MALAAACRSTRDRGANLVEMALVIPLLLLLLAGVADLGRAYHTYITMINAAREGARYAVNNPTDHGGITAHVLSEAGAGGVDLSAATITIDEHGTGNPVLVTINLDFDLLLGAVLGQPDIPIEVSATFAAR